MKKQMEFCLCVCVKISIPLLQSFCFAAKQSNRKQPTTQTSAILSDKFSWEQTFPALDLTLSFQV